MLLHLCLNSRNCWDSREILSYTPLSSLLHHPPPSLPCWWDPATRACVILSSDNLLISCSLHHLWYVCFAVISSWHFYEVLQTNKGSERNHISWCFRVWGGGILIILMSFLTIINWIPRHHWTVKLPALNHSLISGVWNLELWLMKWPGLQSKEMIEHWLLLTRGAKLTLMMMSGDFTTSSDEH